MSPTHARAVVEALSDARGAQYVAHVQHEEHTLARKAVEAATEAGLLMVWSEASGSTFTQTRQAIESAVLEMTNLAHRLADQSRASRQTRLRDETMTSLSELVQVASS